MYACSLNKEKFTDFESEFGSSENWRLCRSGTAPGYEGDFVDTILDTNGAYLSTFKNCVMSSPTPISMDDMIEGEIDQELPISMDDMIEKEIDQELPYEIQELPPMAELPFQELPPELPYPM